MRFHCPQLTYRLLAATVVLITVTGFGLMAPEYARQGHAGIPAYSLSVGARETAVPHPVLREREMFSVDVTVTGYSSSPGQTDSTPFITASNTKVREGIIAVSRDLLSKFTPGAPFQYGDVVKIDGIGTFRIEDTMNQRYEKRADIWFPDHRTARTWGIQKGTLVKLLENEHNIGAPANARSPLAGEAE